MGLDTALDSIRLSKSLPVGELARFIPAMIITYLAVRCLLTSSLHEYYFDDGWTLHENTGEWLVMLAESICNGQVYANILAPAEHLTSLV